MTGTSFSAPARRRTSLCLECTGSLRWSNAGYLEHITAQYSRTSSTTILTSSRFASTAAVRAHAACCSTDCLSKPLSLRRSLTPISLEDAVSHHPERSGAKGIPLYFIQYPRKLRGRV